MPDIFVLFGIMFGALAAYCLWNVVVALRTGVVDSPTMLSPGKTKATDALVSYWAQVLFWLAGGCVLGFKVAMWCHAIIAA